MNYGEWFHELPGKEAGTSQVWVKPDADGPMLHYRNKPVLNPETDEPIATLSDIELGGPPGDGSQDQVRLGPGGTATIVKHTSTMGWSVEIFMLIYMLWGAVIITILYAILRNYFPALHSEMTGSGMTQVKETLARGSHLKWQTVLLRTFACAVHLGSGAPQGIEGPTIQCGVAIATQLAHWMRIKSKEVMVMVAFIGCVSGVSAAFNTPIAGVTFALEEFMDQMHTKVVNVLSVASVSSTLMLRYILGNEVEEKFQSQIFEKSYQNHQNRIEFHIF